MVKKKKTYRIRYKDFTWIVLKGTFFSEHQHLPAPQKGRTQLQCAQRDSVGQRGFVICKFSVKSDEWDKDTRAAADSVIWWRRDALRPETASLCNMVHSQHIAHVTWIRCVSCVDALYLNESFPFVMFDLTGKVSRWVASVYFYSDLINQPARCELWKRFFVCVFFSSVGLIQFQFTPSLSSRNLFGKTLNLQTCWDGENTRLG